MIDPVTLFYRLKPGMEVIEKVRGKYPQGMFILVDICHFTIITRDFGLTFRDVVLEVIYQNCFWRCVPKIFPDLR